MSTINKVDVCVLGVGLTSSSSACAVGAVNIHAPPSFPPQHTHYHHPACMSDHVCLYHSPELAEDGPSVVVACETSALSSGDGLRPRLSSERRGAFPAHTSHRHMHTKPEHVEIRCGKLGVRMKGTGKGASEALGGSWLPKQHHQARHTRRVRGQALTFVSGPMEGGVDIHLRLLLHCPQIRLVVVQVHLPRLPLQLMPLLQQLLPVLEQTLLSQLRLQDPRPQLLDLVVLVLRELLKLELDDHVNRRLRG